MNNNMHRKKMEKHLNRKLNKDELVHHINGNKNDNRLENLMVVSPVLHRSLHPRAKPGTRRNRYPTVIYYCLDCGSDMFVQQYSIRKYCSRCVTRRESRSPGRPRSEVLVARAMLPVQLAARVKNEKVSND